MQAQFTARALQTKFEIRKFHAGQKSAVNLKTAIRLQSTNHVHGNFNVVNRSIGRRRRISVGRRHVTVEIDRINIEIKTNCAVFGSRQ